MNIRKQIYRFIDMYVDTPEPKKLCSSIQDLVEELAEYKVKNIEVIPCCTELNHDLKIGDKVVVTNKYVATISAFCADNDLIEIEDGCDYKQVDKEDVTKVV